MSTGLNKENTWNNALLACSTIPPPQATRPMEVMLPLMHVYSIQIFTRSLRELFLEEVVQKNKA